MVTDEKQSEDKLNSNYFFQHFVVLIFKSFLSGTWPLKVATTNKELNSN